MRIDFFGGSFRIIEFDCYTIVDSLLVFERSGETVLTAVTANIVGWDSYIANPPRTHKTFASDPSLNCPKLAPGKPLVICLEQK